MALFFRRKKTAKQRLHAIGERGSSVGSQQVIARALRHTSGSGCPDAAALAAKLADALCIIETSLFAIDAIDEHLLLAEDIITEGCSTSDNDKRNILAARYSDLVDQVYEAARGATYQGSNLLVGNQPDLEVPLDTSGRTQVRMPHTSLQPVEMGGDGLVLIFSDADPSSDKSWKTIGEAVRDARRRTRTFADILSSNVVLLAGAYRDMKRRAGTIPIMERGRIPHRPATDQASMPVAPSVRNKPSPSQQNAAPYLDPSDDEDAFDDSLDADYASLLPTNHQQDVGVDDEDDDWEEDSEPGTRQISR